MLDLLICPGCGDKAAAPIVADRELACAHCGCRWPFRRLPLFALTGPSGAGKSTVGPRLAELLDDRVVTVEQDVLWTAGLRDDVDGHPVFRSAWLRMAAMIHQSGRPVVLCGTVVPAEFEHRPERVLFSDIHYLALVSDSAALAARLRRRPRWREWDEPRIAEMLEFNEWLRAEAATMTPAVDLFDTTEVPIEAAAQYACAWITARLPVP
ncbi:AAA family ATPase [Pseudonocardia spinosispora]|uniref:AAA family ATPase n=1 Tax=Pseudonocardia spinosispora TaxID=103441 RepID=UPI00041E3AA4|nr:AAA family ATPase [Pseudonocardia spinosispora]